MDERQDLDVAAMKRLLEGERDDIQKLSAAAVDERRPVTLDQQSVGRLSRMDAMQVQAMAQAVDARRQARIGLIAQALGRIEAGEYGYCESCGEDIPAKRIAIDPTVTRCVDCAG